MEFIIVRNYLDCRLLLPSLVILSCLPCLSIQIIRHQVMLISSMLLIIIKQAILALPATFASNPSWNLLSHSVVTCTVGPVCIGGSSLAFRQVKPPRCLVRTITTVVEVMMNRDDLVQSARPSVLSRVLYRFTFEQPKRRGIARMTMMLWCQQQHLTIRRRPRLFVDDNNSCALLRTPPFPLDQRLLWVAMQIIVIEDHHHHTITTTWRLHRQYFPCNKRCYSCHHQHPGKEVPPPRSFCHDC